MIFNIDSWAKVINSIKKSVTENTNNISKNTTNISDLSTQLGGCRLKYENGKFYVGHDDATTEV